MSSFIAINIFPNEFFWGSLQRLYNALTNKKYDWKGTVGTYLVLMAIAAWGFWIGRGVGGGGEQAWERYQVGGAKWWQAKKYIMIIIHIYRSSFLGWKEKKRERFLFWGNMLLKSKGH